MQHTRTMYPPGTTWATKEVDEYHLVKHTLSSMYFRLRRFFILCSLFYVMKLSTQFVQRAISVNYETVFVHPLRAFFRDRLWTLILIEASGRGFKMLVSTSFQLQRRRTASNSPPSLSLITGRYCLVWFGRNDHRFLQTQTAGYVSSKPLDGSDISTVASATSVGIQ